MYRISKFAIDGISNSKNDIMEGYTDGSLWNGWAVVACTREQISKWMAKSPYGHRFLNANSQLNPRDYPVLVLDWEDGEQEIIESSPLWTGSEFKEVYFLDGWCWVEMRN